MVADQARTTARHDYSALPIARPLNRWWVVVASVLGLIVAQGPINAFASAVFLKPVTESLGIGRGTFSAGLLLSTVLSAIVGPIVGRLIDRWGARSVLLCGIVLFAIATAGMAMLQPSPVIFYGLFALSGLSAAAQLPTGYAKAIASRFDKERGLALGVGMAGAGLGVALVPQLAGWLIQAQGWRIAYLGLGIAILILAFAPVAAFIRDGHPQAQPRRAATRPVADVPGLTAFEAATGSWSFWALMISFLLAVMAINGTLIHLVALLTDRGISAEAARAVLSASGLAVIGGRVLSGYLLDRVFGPWVALVFLVCPMIGIAGLASGGTGPVPIIGGIFCGLGIGAEIDLMAFFVSRYLGLKAFGEIYGYAMCILTAGSGLGIYAMGLSYDLAHAYLPALVLFEVGLFVACAIVARLGPYRFPAGLADAMPAE
jgi:MFS family permease